MGVLIALWATDSAALSSRFDTLALRGTTIIIAVIALVLTTALIVLAVNGAAQSALWAYPFIALLTLVIGLLCWRWKAPAHSRPLTIGRAYVAYALTFIASALLLFPIFDRWQDLDPLAQRIQADTRGQTLGLLNPDETTLAMLDYRRQTPFMVVPDNAAGSAEAVAQWFAVHGEDARILVKLPGHAEGELTPLLSKWQRRKPLNDGLAAALEKAQVAQIVGHYSGRHTRRYALLAPVAGTG
jgi:hypothetical protein